MFTTEQIRQLIADDRLDQFYKEWYWRTLALRIIREHHKHLRDYPELAYEPSNLMPLCHDCHERIHERGIYARERQRYTNEEKW